MYVQNSAVNTTMAVTTIRTDDKTSDWHGSGPWRLGTEPYGPISGAWSSKRRKEAGAELVKYDEAERGRVAEHPS